MKILVVGGKRSVGIIQHVAEHNQLFADLEYLYTETYEEIVHELHSRQLAFDGILFTGATPFEYVSSRVQPLIPWEALPHTPQAFLATLLKAGSPHITFRTEFIDLLYFNGIKNIDIINSPAETQTLAEAAVQDDTLYLIPAFSGLGAPYWDSYAKAAIVGMTRTTGKAEIVRAGVECIAYQITDIVKAMSEDAGVKVSELRVDGGPTRNSYLMQFQSDIAEANVQVPDSEELSGIGPAYAAGLALGVWDETIFNKLNRVKYEPNMGKELRDKKYAGWKSAVQTILTK